MFRNRYSPRTILSGSVIGGLNQRRGTIIDTEMRDDEFTLIAEVALNDMFGYSSQLRGMTQGKGELSSHRDCRQSELNICGVCR